MVALEAHEVAQWAWRHPGWSASKGIVASLSRQPSEGRQGTRAMTNFRAITHLATAAILLAAMTACADNRKDPEPSGSPAPSSTAPTTAPSTPPSDQEIASEAASDVVRQYFATVDLLRQESKRPPSELTAVAASTQLGAQRTLLESQRKDGLHQIGDTKVVELEIQSIDLDNSDPAAGRVPTVMVDVCWDVNQVDIVDKDGKSVVSPDRPAIGWTRLTVANYDWASEPTGGWRVAGGQDLKKAPCAAS